MSSIRTQKISHAYAQHLSEILLFDVKDPKLKGVYVTHVMFAPDLKLAKVYFRCENGQSYARDALAGLQNAKGFLRREVAARVQMKHTPELRFYYDDTLEVQEQVVNVFQKIEEGN